MLRNTYAAVVNRNLNGIIQVIFSTTYTNCAFIVGEFKGIVQ